MMLYFMLSFTLMLFTALWMMLLGKKVQLPGPWRRGNSVQHPDPAIPIIRTRNSVIL